MNKEMEIAQVVAYDENWVIGNNNKLPWPRIEEDMQHFRDLTMGHHVLMGRKTHESIGRVLEGRENMILTSNPHYRAEGCFVFPALGNAIHYAQTHGESELMVIGGARVYEITLPLAKRIYATVVKGRFNGNVYYPQINEGEWKEVSREEHPEINPPLVYRTLERRG